MRLDHPHETGRRALLAVVRFSLLVRRSGIDRGLIGEIHDRYSDRRYFVDPARIRHKLSPYIGSALTGAFSEDFVVPGLWDRLCVRYQWHPVVLQRLALQGLEPPTSRTTHRLDRARRRRYRTPEDRKRRYAQIDETLQSIAADGYRSQSLAADRPDEIGICITRDGRLAWARQGDHRLTLAQVLEVPRVPVFLRGMHRGWIIEASRRSPGMPVGEALDLQLRALGLCTDADGSDGVT